MAFILAKRDWRRLNLVLTKRRLSSNQLRTTSKGGNCAERLLQRLATLRGSGEFQRRAYPWRSVVFRTFDGV